LKYIYLNMYMRWQCSFDSYTYVFGKQLFNGSDDNVVRPNGEKPEVENPRWRPLNLKYVYLNMYMRWQGNFDGYAYVFGSIYPMAVVAMLCNPMGRNRELEIHDGGYVATILDL